MQSTNELPVTNQTEVKRVGILEPMFEMPSVIDQLKRSPFIPDYRFSFVCATETYDSTFKVKGGKAV